MAWDVEPALDVSDAVAAPALLLVAGPGEGISCAGWLWMGCGGVRVGGVSMSWRVLQVSLIDSVVVVCSEELRC